LAKAINSSRETLTAELSLNPRNHGIRRDAELAFEG
jgi:hypothetical protein